MAKIGIYKIASICKPERIYVGSSVNIYYRWKDHKNHLAKGILHAPHFIRHYNKYGINDLSFSIIEQFEFQSKEHLLQREQYYIDILKPYFNGSLTAGSPLGYKHSKETIQKRLATFKKIGYIPKPPNALGIKRSIEWSKKHTEINFRLGLKPPSRKGIKYLEDSLHRRKGINFPKERREKLREAWVKRRLKNKVA
jgi:group I intron endonuclease